MTRFCTGCMLAFVQLSHSACAGNPSGPLALEIDTIVVSPAPIAQGRTTQVLATSIDFDGKEIPDVTYKWRSSDDAIVTVDSLGTVTGRALGSATITASVEGQSGAVEMSVTPVGVLGLRRLANGLGLLTQVVFPPDDPSRLFAVERRGTVRVIRNGTLFPTPFLDISRLVSERGGEQGLVSVAFHLPEHPEINVVLSNASVMCIQCD